MIYEKIDNRVYIAETHIGRASDWYDDARTVPSLWNPVPIVNKYISFFHYSGIPFLYSINIDPTCLV